MKYHLREYCRVPEMVSFYRPLDVLQCISNILIHMESIPMINFKKFYKYGMFSFPIQVSIDDIEGIVSISAADFSAKFLLDTKEFNTQYLLCIENLKRSVDNSAQLKKLKRELIENGKFELSDIYENRSDFTLKKSILHKGVALFVSIRYSYGQVIIDASTAGDSWHVRQEVLDFNDIHNVFCEVNAQFRDYIDGLIRQGTSTLISKLESIGFEKEVEQ